MRDLALRGISFDAEIALDGEDATPWESASEPEPQHFATFLEAYDFQIKIASGAAQEGDCPCGATVVRKSDSANKSKLCADCAAQEEAPSPATLQPLLDHIADRVKLLSSAQIGFEKWDACCEGIAKLLQTGWPFPDLDAIKKSVVVAEEEAGAPTKPKCGNCGGSTEQAEDRHWYCTNPDCANRKPVVAEAEPLCLHNYKARHLDRAGNLRCECGKIIPESAKGL